MQDKGIMDEKILHGLISLYILRELVVSPMHGYELRKRISSVTGKPMPQGSIYVLLKSLKTRNYVTLEHVSNEKGQILCRYHITDNGKEFLKIHEESLRIARGIIDDLIFTADKIR